MTKRRKLLALAIAGALLVPLIARAHGRFPATVSLALLRGGDGSNLMLGTTYGALISRDRGAHWDWICEEAIGYRSGFDPSFVWTDADTVYTPSFDGLLVSRNGGCDWGPHPDFGSDKTVSDLEPVPNDPRGLLAAAMTSTVDSALFRSTDGGLHFTATTLTRSRAVISSVRVSPADPMRIYAAGWYFAPRGQWTYRSDDGGQTWSETLHAFDDEGLFAVIAVHPTNRDVLWARVAGVTADHIVRSTDAGASFTEVLTLPEGFRSIALSDDAATVWVASPNKLYRSSDSGVSFTPLAKPTRNACVTRDGPTLYSCGWPFEDGFALGKSSDGGDTFEKVYTLNEIRGPLVCPASSHTQMTCAVIWPIIADLLGVTPGGPGADAGTTDAGDGTDGDKKCGCTAADTSASPLAILLAPLALLFRARARTRRRSTDARTCRDRPTAGS